MRGVSDEGIEPARTQNTSNFTRRPSFAEESAFNYDDDDDESYDYDKSVYGDDKSFYDGGRSVVSSSRGIGDDRSYFEDNKSMYEDEEMYDDGRSMYEDDEKSMYSVRSRRRMSGVGMSGIADYGPEEEQKQTLFKTHEGEHLADFGGLGVPLSKKVTLFALCAALNSCNLGYDIGASSAAEAHLSEAMDLNRVQIDIFIASLNLFAMTGALTAHMIADSYGRRGAFMVSALVLIVGIVIMAISNNFVSLMFGRVFVGLGVGFGFAIDPIYISEIAPAAHRGRLVTWSEVGTNVGIIFGFIVGLMFGHLDSDTAWRCMFGMGIILPSIMIILLWTVMPESPRWLVQQERDMEAAHVLQKIYGEEYDVVSLVNSMKMSMLKDQEIERSEGWYLILFPATAFRRIILLGLGVAMAQQVVGIDSIQYFLISILKDSGIQSSSGQKWVLIVLGCFRLVFIIIGGRLFDQKGRKPLIFISLAGCAVALLLLSFNFYGAQHSNMFAIFCCAIYFSFYSVGIGPGGWLIPAETFPSSIRAKGMSLAVFLNRACATLVFSTYESIAQALSWSGFFLFMSCLCGVVALFMAALLPETKGRSLEDMLAYFAEITGDRSILQVELAHQGEGLMNQDEVVYEEEAGNENVVATGMMA